MSACMHVRGGAGAGYRIVPLNFIFKRLPDAALGSKCNKSLENKKVNH
jgi:hypothetical protein